MVARCTVERLMKADGLRGVVRGAKIKTTKPGPKVARPEDLVERQFKAQEPNQLWVVDFERHEAFANPGGGGRPPLDACRSRCVEAGGRSIASAWGWLVEQSSTTREEPAAERSSRLNHRPEIWRTWVGSHRAPDDPLGRRGTPRLGEVAGRGGHGEGLRRSRGDGAGA